MTPVTCLHCLSFGTIASKPMEPKLYCAVHQPAATPDMPPGSEINHIFLLENSYFFLTEVSQLLFPSNTVMTQKTATAMLLQPKGKACKIYPQLQVDGLGKVELIIPSDITLGMQQWAKKLSQ